MEPKGRRLSFCRRKAVPSRWCAVQTGSTNERERRKGVKVVRDGSHFDLTVGKGVLWRSRTDTERALQSPRSRRQWSPSRLLSSTRLKQKHGSRGQDHRGPTLWVFLTLSPPPREGSESVPVVALVLGSPGAVYLPLSIHVHPRHQPHNPRRPGPPRNRGSDSCPQGVRGRK